MKRIIYLLLSICLAAALCACTAKDVPTPETTIVPQETSEIPAVDPELVNSIRQKIAAAQDQDTKLKESVSQSGSQADLNGVAYQRNALWQTLHAGLWNALEQTLNADAMDDLLAEHLNWSAEKRITLNLLAAEAGGGSLTGTLVDGESAELTRERVLVLFSYLEGAASPPPRASGTVLSPAAMVESIVDAYFRGDHETIGKHLSESYLGVIEVRKRETLPACTVNSLDSIPSQMALYGYINPSVEFLDPPDSDSPHLLSMTLIWENNRWAIESYGTEPPAVSDTLATTTEAVLPDAQSVLESMLKGNGRFYDIDFEIDVTISEACAVWGKHSGITVTTPKYSAVDMDGDGIKEVIFKVLINGVSDYGVKVIHYENGKLYGFTFSERQLMNIKADGSFAYSGSGSSDGTAKIVFAGDACSYIDVPMDLHFSQPDISWYDYPGSNDSDILN